MDRVLDETEAIWGSSGIRFDWHRVTSRETPGGWRLTVTIEDGQEGHDDWQAPLGWILFRADGPAPAPSIHLSRTNAESLIRRAPGVTDLTAATHETLVGRALGRALSHELGHYLLKSNVHTPHGLMRASWPTDELLGIDRRGFELTADQRAAAEWLQTSELDGRRVTASSISVDGVRRVTGIEYA